MKNKKVKSNKKVITTTTTTTTVVETSLPSKASTIYYKFILDRSGSMGHIQKPTVDSYNEQLGKLKRLRNEFPDQKYMASLVIFDDVIETVFEDQPIEDVKLLTYEDYQPRGTTALYDAIGMTVQNAKIKIGKLLTENVNDTECIIVVLTDGQENASTEYDSTSIKNIISEANGKENWTLMFVGSDESSILNAKNIGFHAGNVARANYNASGIATANNALSNTMYRGAYARSKGVSMDKTNVLGFASDDTNFLTDKLDLSDIDDAAKDSGRESE